MVKAFFWSRRWLLWAWGGGLLLALSLYAQVYMSVLFNAWYGAFYDLLQNIQGHTFSEFRDYLFRFAYIALPYVALATVTNFFTRMYSLRWREATTFAYIPRLRRVVSEIEGASQRIQEDAFRWSRITESLVLKSVRGVMTLIAFLPILWQLSERLLVPILPEDGSLVWLALIISVGGTAISWVVGIKLPGLEYQNQKVEAAFRKELVLGEDDKVHHAHVETLAELFTGIRFNYQRLFFNYGYYDLWSNLFFQSLVLVPFLVGGPALFAGAITLGTLIQIDNAFSKVYGVFTILVDDWTTITELRSIWKRLHEFEANLRKYDTGVTVAEAR